MLEIAGDVLRVTFDSWTPEAYEMFLRTKGLPEHEIRYDDEADTYTVLAPARFAPLLGFQAERPPAESLPVAEHLWDYQRHFLRVALEAKRYALFWDTGIGKTPMFLEWCRQVLYRTQGKVLYICPLNLIPQVLDMAKEFYGAALDLEVLESRKDLRWWAGNREPGQPSLAITNPEKFLPAAGEPEITPEIAYLSGIALDEASILKTGGGRTKWALIKSCRGVEYKLAGTATPAPNDPIEYASQASWLEKIRDEGEVIWTFFVRDKEGEWKIKDHALAAFYRFLSGWSCYVRHPARYGFADNLRDLPEPQRFEHRIAPATEQLAAIRQVADGTGQTSLVDPARLGIVERGRFGQLAAGFLYGKDGSARRINSAKPWFIADLVRREVASDLQVLVWTLFDETVEILREELAGADFPVAVITGKVPRANRPAIVEAFRAGAVRVLISRPEVLGFGFNLQMAGSMVFADLNDSYEQVYQAERRAYRYGQTKSVRIHFPLVAGLQDVVWDNLQSKRAAFERDVARMERLYLNAMRDQPPKERAA